MTALRTQAKTLRTRKADLDQPPEALTPSDLAAIRAEIRRILTEETHNARKALFEALVHEITITADDTVRPVFKLPLARNDEGLAPDGPTLTDRDGSGTRRTANGVTRWTGARARHDLWAEGKLRHRKVLIRAEITTMQGLLSKL